MSILETDKIKEKLISLTKQTSYMSKNLYQIIVHFLVEFCFKKIIIAWKTR